MNHISQIRILPYLCYAFITRNGIHRLYPITNQARLTRLENMQRELMRRDDQDWYDTRESNRP